MTREWDFAHGSVIIEIVRGEGDLVLGWFTVKLLGCGLEHELAASSHRDVHPVEVFLIGASNSG